MSSKVMGLFLALLTIPLTGCPALSARDIALEKANTFVADARFQEAKEELTEHLKKEPEDKELKKKLESIEKGQEQSKTKSAKEWFQIALTSEKDVQEKIRSYSRAIGLKEDFTHAVKNRGATYYQIGKKDLALIDFESVLMVSPMDPQAHHSLAVTHHSLGNSKKALRSITAAIDLLKTGGDPDSKDDLLRAYQLRALLYRSLEAPDFSKAEADYSAIIELQPDNAPAKLDLGLTRLKLGNNKEARKQFGNLIALDDKSAAAHFGAAMADLRMGLNDEAQTLLEKVVVIEPGHTAAWLQLGFLYGKTKRLDDARKAFKTYVEKGGEKTAWFNNALNALNENK